MHEFIEKVVDVAYDGHCELCVVRGLHDMFVDDYHIIQYQLLKEMIDDDNDRYLRLIGSEKGFNDVKHALASDGIDLAPPDKWMIMLDMGFLINHR